VHSDKISRFSSVCALPIRATRSGAAALASAVIIMAEPFNTGVEDLIDHLHPRRTPALVFKAFCGRCFGDAGDEFGVAAAFICINWRTGSRNPERAKVGIEVAIKLLCVAK
jgi:hypothetical protein